MLEKIEIFVRTFVCLFLARGFAYVRDCMLCMDLYGSFCLVGIDKAERSGSYEFAIRDYCVSA